MIVEDYVSFEIAQLLQEKGFNGICRAGYTSDGSLKDIEVKEYLTNATCPDTYWKCTAPTLQMAMKWLRDIYGLHVWVEYSRFDFNNERPYLWNIVETKIDGCYWGGSYHKRPETAVEEAIKYSITNLI